MKILAFFLSFAFGALVRAPPSPKDRAAFARWMVAKNTWGALATT